ncbi:hypothetical protein [Oryzomicrobium terrae]|uniref:hypothetical protein n=1 Tax=Oryzomicrobium terrae TaxID=1735038 RepID=UPI001CA8AD10|nr:hypothetical protein [Oryzomicrobium terrae]
MYRLFQLVTGPVVRAMRRVTPRFIVDAHVPLLTFFVLFWLWLALAYVRQVLCIAGGTGCPA